MALYTYIKRTQQHQQQRNEQGKRRNGKRLRQFHSGLFSIFVNAENQHKRIEAHIHRQIVVMHAL